LTHDPAEILISGRDGFLNPLTVRHIPLGAATAVFLLAGRLQAANRSGLDELYVALVAAGGAEPSKMVCYRNLRGEYQPVAERSLSAWGNPVQGALVRVGDKTPQLLAMLLQKDQQRVLVMDDWSGRKTDFFD
jgi:hypothetical protein